MPFICFNGYIIRQEELAINIHDEAWRWGHGFFESGRWVNNRWPLAPYHHERIQRTAAALHLHLPVTTDLENKVAETVAANNRQAGARIRIQFWPGEKSRLNYCIEATPLQPLQFEWPVKGKSVAVYKDFIKCADAFSSLKLCSYAPYLQARRWATAQGFDEALLVNSNGRICEGAHSNIFILQNNTWVTPPLSEAPVAGVCRQYILANAASKGIAVQELPVNVAQLKGADEVILTNAVQGIQWVREWDKHKYQSNEAKKMHSLLFEPFNP